jgi:methionyl-tRNA synthetase
LTPKSRVYLTTPIYYATGAPHIGHAYTTLLADALARYHRQRGAEVHFLTGTDEHGQKIQEEASRREIRPIELCDEMAERFRQAWSDLEVGHDRFIRTTEPEHVAVVRALLERLHARDLIYEDLYRGWYCVHEERYWTTKDLTPEGNCPDCNRPVREIEEKNWFFRMSRFQDDLIRHIEENPGWIHPENRRNEVLGFLRQPLGDLSISRPRTRLDWGIPIPWDEEHVTYVWVDALTNYLTASGRIHPGAPEGEQGFEAGADESWWPADLHIIGKDILTTHAVYWPTLLMGAGLPLPQRILAHGWWVVGDAKMSKSIGNVVDPLELRSEFGVDAVRWYLLREMPTGGDASYTRERFLTRYDELANILGNLASRVTSMVVRYRDGALSKDAPSHALDDAIDRTLAVYHEKMEALRVHEAFAAAMELAREANGFVEAREPWAQARDPKQAEALDETLASLLRVLGVLAALFHPTIPAKAELLAEAVGFARTPTLDEARGTSPGGRSVTKLSPLFPKPERG